MSNMYPPGYAGGPPVGQPPSMGNGMPPQQPGMPPQQPGAMPPQPGIPPQQPGAMSQQQPGMGNAGQYGSQPPTMAMPPVNPQAPGQGEQNPEEPPAKKSFFSLKGSSNKDQAPSGPDPIAVNLLPKKYKIAIEVNRAKRQVMLILSAALIVVIAVFAFAMTQVAVATAQRSSAQQAQSAAQAEVDQYREIPEITAEIAALEQALASSLATEVLFSDVIAGTVNGLPPGTVLDSLQLTLAQGATAGQAGKGGESGEDFGDVAIQGKVPAFETSGLLLQALQRNNQLANTWLGSATRNEDGTFSFNIAADLSREALSQRYVKQQQQGATQP